MQIKTINLSINFPKILININLYISITHNGKESYKNDIYNIVILSLII